MEKIQASAHAFAAVLADGSVVTWGSPEFGGDSSSVRDELKNVPGFHTWNMISDSKEAMKQFLSKTVDSPVVGKPGE